MKQKDFSGASLVSDHIRVWQLATSMKQKIAVSSMGNRPSAEFFCPYRPVPGSSCWLFSEIAALVRTSGGRDNCGTGWIVC